MERAEFLRRITVKVNGRTYTDEVEPRLLLVNYLRDILGLTGTHVSCDTSNCGACTVLVNGKSVKSCTMFAVQADGAEIITIEGLAVDGILNRVQQAFLENNSVQCGFCTPGMVLQAYWILKENQNPSEQEIRRGLAGNLCRCTGYQNIVKAVSSAAKAKSGWRTE